MKYLFYFNIYSIFILSFIPFFALGAQSEGTDRLFEEEMNQRSSDGERDTNRSTFQFSNSTGKNLYLDIAAAADLYGEWDKERDVPIVKHGITPLPERIASDKANEWRTPPIHATQNRASLRATEIGLIASVDHLSEARVTIGAAEENGAFSFNIEEAYLYFPNTFLPRTSIRAGKLLLDVGRINTQHQHDWPFTTPPVVHRELLGAENASDTGIEFQFLFPWPFWQELTIGIFNGDTFGQTEGATPVTKQNPLVTAHLKQFVSLGENTGMQFGFSYLGWHPDTHPTKRAHQSGFDLLIKWKRGKLRSFQWLSEVWYREERQKNERPFDPPATPVEVRVGAYTYGEYRFHENWLFGARLDRFTNPNFRGENGYMVKNGTVEISGIIGWNPSEFSRFRATLAQSREVLHENIDNILYLQGTFLMGAHPQHVY